MGGRIQCCYCAPAPQRLDKTLSEILGCSRAAAVKRCARVQVNGRAADFSRMLRHGDAIDAEFFSGQNAQGDADDAAGANDAPDGQRPPAAPPNVLAGALPALEILYQDEHTIVINKPRGVVVHRGAGGEQATIAAAVFSRLVSFDDALAAEGRAGIVHRLDKDTTGALLIARSKEAHQFYAAQFAARRVRKIYLSVLKGTPAAARGRVDTHIARHSVKRKQFAVIADASRGKEASSEYELLSAGKDYSLVQWNIFTGRTHQIRVHAKHINCPVLGDAVYSRAAGPAGGMLRRAPLMLHAWKLGIVLYGGGVDSSGQPLQEFCAPVPEDMRAVCTELGFSPPQP